MINMAMTPLMPASAGLAVEAVGELAEHIEEIAIARVVGHLEGAGRDPDGEEKRLGRHVLARRRA